jgi:hypothetical protein
MPVGGQRKKGRSETKSRKGIHGIIRAREEPHTTSTGLHETPSVADLLANDGDFVARFHIQLPEFSFACERVQHSRLASADVVLPLEMIVLVCVIV